MGAGHNHGDTSNRKRLAIAMSLTGTVFIAEIIGAWITGSLALFIDAIHMLTDLVGLIMAFTAATLMQRPPSSRRTWGLRRAEVLSALAQATVLLAVGVYTGIEGIRRLSDPPEIAPDSLLIFGIIGLAANVVSLIILFGGRGNSLNLKAAFLEVTNDALGSVAVIVSAILIATLGWLQADAISAMVIAVLIIPRTIIILREAGAVLLESTPKGIDLDKLREHLEEKPGVIEVHDLHVTSISTDLPVLTAHVIAEDSVFEDGRAPQVLDSLQQCVAEHFPVAVNHSTFQLEPAGHQQHEDVHHDGGGVPGHTH